MENEKKEDSKLLEHYKQSKLFFSSQALKIKDSNFLKSIKSNVNHLSDISKTYTNKAAKKLNTLLFENKLDYLVLDFIKQTSNKRTLKLKLNEKEDISFNYRNRRLLVISFTFGSLIFHSIKNKALYSRVIVPYFIFYSLIFARENLNPYEI